MQVAVYDTKPYDRQYLEQQNAGITWHFFEFRLNAQTAELAAGCPAVCVFVNDQVEPTVVPTKNSPGKGRK